MGLTGVCFAQEERQPPPAFFLTEEDKVYILLGKVPNNTEGFNLYKKVDETWQLLNEEPIKAIRDPLEFRNAIDEDLYAWLKKATKGETEYEVLRRILRDRGLIVAFSVVNLKLAQALGRLYVDKEVTSGKKYTYKIVFIDLFDKEIDKFVKSVVVTKARVPKPPFEARAEVGDSEIRITWKYHKLPIQYEYTAVGFNIYRKEEKEFMKVNKVLLLWQEDKTFWVDYDVINGKKYQYYVSAVDLIGKESTPSNYTEFVIPIDKTPPLMPEGVVTAPQEDKIAIAWKMNLELDLTGYNIYRGESLQEGEEFKKINKELITGDFPYYEDKEVIPGKSYFYRISAVDTAGNESRQTPGYSAMLKDTTPPGLPTDLKFRYDVKKHIVELSWKKPKDEDLLGFYLYRGASTQTTMKITQHPVKKPEYKDDAYHHRWIIPGKGYFWGVCSVDNSYNESQKVWIKGDIPDDEPPLTPKSIYAHSQDDGKIQITWQISLSWDVGGYKLYRGQEDKPILLKEVATSTSYIDEDVEKGKRYFYCVSAVDKAGNESKSTDKFYVTSADIYSPPTPKNIKAVYIKEKKYALITWDKVEVDDLAGYEVYVCDLPTGLYKKLNDKLVREERFIHQEGKEELYYKVRAVDTSSNPSRYSEFTQAVVKK